MNERRAAYTLVEVVVTVLIMGIVTAVAVPRFAGTLQHHRVQAAALRIQAELKRLRERAIARSSTQSAQFWPAFETFQSADLADLDHRGQTLTIDLNGYPYRALIVSAVLGSDSVIQFDQFGRPDSGGVVTLACGGAQQTVTIDAESGDVTVP